MTQKVLLKLRPGCSIPEYATEGAAALDLRADLGSAPVEYLRRGDRLLVNTGLSIAMPQGMAALVLPRSGLALKHGVTVANAPGLIDSDYRGEIGVILQNHGDVHFTINHGDRIAQLMFIGFHQVEFEEVIDLPDTVRGSGGFGSSGVK